jgi:predicted ATPase
MQPINVLIGANGSGKSNFISVFRLLENIYNQRLQSYIKQNGGAERLSRK